LDVLDYILDRSHCSFPGQVRLGEASCMVAYEQAEG
jgi:hypothetical protein